MAQKAELSGLQNPTPPTSTRGLVVRYGFEVVDED